MSDIQSSSSTGPTNRPNVANVEGITTIAPVCWSQQQHDGDDKYQERQLRVAKLVTFTLTWEKLAVNVPAVFHVN